MTLEKGLRGVKSGTWCDHDYPIEVCVYDRGRRARCLRCHVVGPVVRGGADTARQALLEAGRGNKR
jgi:hypothetical protein